MVTPWRGNSDKRSVANQLYRQLAESLLTAASWQDLSRFTPNQFSAETPSTTFRDASQTFSSTSFKIWTVSYTSQLFSMSCSRRLWHSSPLVPARQTTPWSRWTSDEPISVHTVAGWQLAQLRSNRAIFVQCDRDDFRTVWPWPFTFCLLTWGSMHAERLL